MPEDTPAYYSAAEAREFAGLLARGAFRVLRGKSTARVDERIDRLKERAAERCQAERDAVEAERRRKVAEKAQARAKRIVR